MWKPCVKVGRKDREERWRLRRGGPGTGRKRGASSRRGWVLTREEAGDASRPQGDYAAPTSPEESVGRVGSDRVRSDGPRVSPLETGPGVQRSVGPIEGIKKPSGDETSPVSDS